MSSFKRERVHILPKYLRFREKGGGGGQGGGGGGEVSFLPVCVSMK